MEKILKIILLLLLLQIYSVIIDIKVNHYQIYININNNTSEFYPLLYFKENTNTYIIYIIK